MKGNADWLCCNFNPNENSSWRYTAYWQFTLPHWGYLGRGKRKVIPSCIVQIIRKRFPDKNEYYTGFLDKYWDWDHIWRNFFFFFYQGFISRTLTTHRTAGDGRGPPLKLITWFSTIIIWSSCGLRKRWNFPALAFRLLFKNHCEMSDKILFNLGIICSKPIPVIKGMVSSA